MGHTESLRYDRNYYRALVRDQQVKDIAARSLPERPNRYQVMRIRQRISDRLERLTCNGS